MTQALQKMNVAPEILQSLVLNGDMSKLNPIQQVEYYRAMCDRLGLDAATKPFDIMDFQGKRVIYAGRSCAAQLNKLHSISHKITSRQMVDTIYTVTAIASQKEGTETRETESIGAVSLVYPDRMRTYENGKSVWKDHPKAGQKMAADELANAIMKAETKAKRRATLDLVGLGILDEIEVEAMPLIAVQEEVISDDQAANINALIDEVKADKENMLKWLKVASIEQIPAARYSEVVKRLEAKRSA